MVIKKEKKKEKKAYISGKIVIKSSPFTDKTIVIKKYQPSRVARA